MSIQISVKPYRALQILDQEAKKNRSSHIPWHKISNNKKYGLLISQNNLYASHEQHLNKLKQAFKKAVKQIQLRMIDKNGQQVPRFYYDQQKDQFIRRNEFQQIKNQQTLLKYIQKNPKGIIVSDQLLQYTYNTIQKDIDKLLNDKKIKRINSSNKTKKDYYIFPNTIEMQYGLIDNNQIFDYDKNQYRFYGKNQYLEFCKKNYATFQDKDGQNMTGTGTMFSYSTAKFNQWVPGYAQLKKQWLLRNQQKASKNK